MIELENSSDKASFTNNKDYMSALRDIPWDRFDIGKSAYLPYSALAAFSSKAHAMNYIRTVSNRRGVTHGFKFKVIDHPELSKIEISCYDRQDALGVKKVGRPRVNNEPPEDRAGRYNRAMRVVYQSITMPSDPTSREWLLARHDVELKTAELFNQYEAQVENPQLIDIERLKAHHTILKTGLNLNMPAMNDCGHKE